MDTKTKENMDTKTKENMDTKTKENMDTKTKENMDTKTTEITIYETVSTTSGDTWERITPWRTESDGASTCWVKPKGNVSPIVFRVLPDGRRNLIMLPDLNPT